MGLAICGGVFYHAPFVIHNPWLKLLHDMLYCGVDMFLFLSGLGACHSIRSRGGWGYLRQRALRLLPGLYLILIPWCLIMFLMGLMSGLAVLGSITLIGWWFGQMNQLNWYFSAVWLFFLLAVPLYRLFSRVKHPVLLWLCLTVLSFPLCLFCPADRFLVIVTRLPVFFTGILFGCLEQRGFSKQWLLRAIAYPLALVGLWLVPVTFWGIGWTYGNSLGLWWYPFALLIPGGAIMVADLAALLRKSRFLSMLMRPVEWCGEASGEILMIHMAIYKIFLATVSLRNRYWACILLGCLVLGCLYRRFVTSRISLPARLTNCPNPVPVIFAHFRRKRY